VLLQVNCSGEEQKYGCAPAAAVHLAEQIETMVHVQLRGVMTMAAHAEDPEHTRATFARCRELFEEVRDSGVVPARFNILSMGMSGDYEIAIEEGSNMVRVGTALFGPARPGAGLEDGEDEDED
jgi:PLP dependent protein